jgi:hypothetical protein
MGLRVLITNITLWPPTGTVLYVRDLALELRRQGHTPMVFSCPAGAIADGLRDAGIAVTDRLHGIDEPPDIIHGHHFVPTLLAVNRWRTVPALHLCHDHLAADDRTPLHPSIRRHGGVSRLCVDRLVREGAPAGDVRFVPNFVDTRRFVPRAPLPARPRRALLFSNYAHDGTHAPAVVEACRRMGLPLDVVGAGVGNATDRPEQVLGHYDIVFAKARAAIEAMAVGAAVVLCDYAGVGPMVTSRDVGDLRELNFGFAALRQPLEPEHVMREIDRYDADDAGRVRDWIRSSASLDHAVDELVTTYRERIAAHVPVAASSGAWLLRERAFLRMYWLWNGLPAGWRAWLRRVPAVGRARAAVRRVLGAT